MSNENEKAIEEIKQMVRINMLTYQMPYVLDDELEKIIEWAAIYGIRIGQESMIIKYQIPDTACKHPKISTPQGLICLTCISEQTRWDFAEEIVKEIQKLQTREGMDIFSGHLIEAVEALAKKEKFSKGVDK